MLEQRAFLDLKKEAIQKGFEFKPTSTKIEIIDFLKAKESEPKKRGRKPESTSKHQQYRKELEERRANGEIIKPGRKKYLSPERAEIERKRAEGILKKGRPVIESSKRQQIINERVARGFVSPGKRGRPLDEGSVRQIKLKTKGQVKRGRPKKQ